MPQKRKSMKQIRKILQLRLNNAAMSIRTIANATGVSRPVVTGYLDRLGQHPLTIEELDAMNDEALRNLLELDVPAVQETEQNKTLQTWLEQHITELSKVGVTRLLLHERYLEDHPDGLQYTQFCFVLKQRFQGPEASSLLDHKAGDKMYVDFTGNKLVWQDTRGAEYTEEIFLAVLGASSFLFALPVQSQRMHDFCYVTEEAFLFYGGVPRSIVPDCLKSAVTSNDGHESVINPLYQRLLDHYRIVCIPARPRHPKDKPLAEGAVNLVYRQILARMDGRRFETREDMLRWWMQAVERINNTPFQKLPGTRRIRFEQTDQSALKTLPDTRFNLSAVLNQTVSTTGVVYIDSDKTYYSVPFSLQGKKVEILVAPKHIEIWYEGERKALHSRQRDAGKIVTPTHRSPAHRWYSDRNTGELMRDLEQRGVHIGSWAARVMNAAEHEDIAWLLLTGLKKLYTKYPNRLDTACRIALKQGDLTLRSLKHILRNDEDLVLVAAEEATPELALHENIRGAEYYATEGASA